MRKVMWIAFVGFVVAVGFNALPALAHHGTAAYDYQKPLTIKGKVTKMEWVNPHAWMYVDVTDSSGKVVNWSVECGAPNALIRRGVRKDSIPIGLGVVVKGYPAKNDRPTLILNSVTREDGSLLLTEPDKEQGAQ